MAKGWKTLKTVNDTPKSNKTQQEKNRAATKADNFIRATKTLRADDLKKQGILHYNQKKSADDALLDAFKEKKLKSKTLIKQALKIKKEREAEEKKKKEEKAAVEESPNEVKEPEPAPAE